MTAGTRATVLRTAWANTPVRSDLAGAKTSIPDTIPADATGKSYRDNGIGDKNQSWADESSTLGSMVKLVDAIRGSSASTTPAKRFFNSPRPWRWAADPAPVLPTLVPEEAKDPKTDYGFPSGHANAAYLTALGLAYAFPERYQEMLTRASELGNDRIVAGMHSPLDVMAGRVMATAITAAVLNDPANASLKNAAYRDAQNILLKQKANSPDRFGDNSANGKNYRARLTYGFSQTGDTKEPMVVPKGAEVLLETRLPYLSAEQRRRVLYTTGIASGYPVLDDTEGWGRLDLLSAADGYGAFVGNVEVSMDASKGGFNASDSWKNDISGAGKLTKEGTGTLKLTGGNIYSGGTAVNDGTLEADSATAFGTGSVVNNGGTIVKNTSGVLTFAKDFSQSLQGTLELNIGRSSDLLKIAGNASFGGKLKLNFTNGYVPANGEAVIHCGANAGNSAFSSVAVTGLPKTYKLAVTYENNTVKLKRTDLDSIALDTLSCHIPKRGGHFEIGVRLLGTKAKSVKVYSTNARVADVAKMKNGDYSVTSRGVGTAYIMFDVYGGGRRRLTHASVRVDVKSGGKPGGNATRQYGLF